MLWSIQLAPVSIYAMGLEKHGCSVKKELKSELYYSSTLCQVGFQVCQLDSSTCTNYMDCFNAQLHHLLKDAFQTEWLAYLSHTSSCKYSTVEITSNARVICKAHTHTCVSCVWVSVLCIWVTSWAVSMRDWRTGFGETWLLCEEGAEEWLILSSTVCQVVFQVLHYANLIVAHAPTTWTALMHNSTICWRMHSKLND